MKSAINWFPELLPREQISMNNWIDSSRKIYEGYGYVPVETAVVENMSVLLAKWSDDKEIYGVKRHFDFWDVEVQESESKMGLHFDLTIPFARYVTSNFNDLEFPFKRYQIQKCWRGERPQLWRYREFLQADVDIVWNEKLPLHFDAEVLEIAVKALNEIVPGKFELFFNNRNFFDGLCDFFSIDEQNKKLMIKTIDKLDKVGKEACIEELQWMNIPLELIVFLVDNSTSKLNKEDIRTKFSAYASNAIIENALSEVETVIDNLLPEVSDLIQLKINLARWLDYYTGSIFEGRLTAYPTLSICGGWRYENLTNTIGNKQLPGVWISLWLTRIFGILDHLKLIDAKKKTNTQVLIGGFNEIQRVNCNKIASILRTKWVNCEIYHDLAQKPGKQIKHATSKWIAYMLFIDEKNELSLKDLNSGIQEVWEIDDILEVLISQKSRV